MSATTNRFDTPNWAETWEYSDDASFIHLELVNGTMVSDFTTIAVDPAFVVGYGDVGVPGSGERFRLRIPWTSIAYASVKPDEMR